MTYYGRWTYKYEEAARQGAKGCFVVHNTVPAGYPFGVVQNSWNTSKLYLDRRGKNVSYCEGIGWLLERSDRKTFHSSGLKFQRATICREKTGFQRTIPQP